MQPYLGKLFGNVRRLELVADVTVSVSAPVIAVLSAEDERIELHKYVAFHTHNSSLEGAMNLRHSAPLEMPFPMVSLFAVILFPRSYNYNSSLKGAMKLTFASFCSS